MNLFNSEPRQSQTPNVRLRHPLRTLAGRAALLGTLAISGVSASMAWADSVYVNINTDSAEVLAEGISGVGIAKAYRIVEYREAHGPFQSVDELVEVSGIGVSIVDRNRERLVVK